MNPTAATSDLARRNTVQGLLDVKTEGALVGSFWALDIYQRSGLLPSWATRSRERALRNIDRNPTNTLWIGAAAGLVNRWCAAPWSIDGGKNLANRFQRLFRGSQFGLGWDSLITRVGRDYLRYDGGAYIEVIAPGDPMREPTGPVVGLAHLDSYHCLPTGDPDYPVLYYSRATAAKPSTIHILHKSRVIHLVDMEDGDQDHPNYGLCALSRAIAVVERQLYEHRYIVENLDDKPSPGVVLVQGISRQAWETAWTQYGQQQNNDDLPPMGKVIPLFGMDAALPLKVDNVTFSRPPEKFDFKVYVDIDVDEMALAIGVDRQDLFPLQTRAMGSGQQSEILAEKAKGKTFGHFLTLLERKLNDVLPEALTFSFKVNDPQKAQEDAATAKGWADFIVQVGQRMTLDEGRRLLAQQVEAFAGVVMDDSGQMVQLSDLDVQPNTEQAIAPDTKPAPAPVTEQPPTGANVTANDSSPNAGAQQKDYDTTRSQFVADFTDLVHAGLTDAVSRRRAGVVLRAQLNRAGKQAREDGLKEGGVEDGLSAEDQADHVAWLARQSSYVTGFLDTVYGDGLTDKEVDSRAEMWSNKALQDAYYEGLASADKNGLYQWQLGAADKHCASCVSMAGQKHRMSEYANKGILPKSDALDCGGYNCQCSLIKVSGRASGDWLGTKALRRKA